MSVTTLWLLAVPSFAILIAAAVWFIRRDAERGVKLENAEHALKATATVKAISHDVHLQSRSVRNDFLHDRLQ